MVSGCWSSEDAAAIINDDQDLGWIAPIVADYILNNYDIDEYYDDEIDDYESEWENICYDIIDEAFRNCFNL